MRVRIKLESLGRLGVFLSSWIAGLTFMMGGRLAWNLVFTKLGLVSIHIDWFDPKIDLLFLPFCAGMGLLASQVKQDPARFTRALFYTLDVVLGDGTPPKFPELLLWMFLSGGERISTIEDTEEIFYKVQERFGPFWARNVWYPCETAKVLWGAASSSVKYSLSAAVGGFAQHIIELIKRFFNW